MLVVITKENRHTILNGVINKKGVKKGNTIPTYLVC